MARRRLGALAWVGLALSVAAGGALQRARLDAAAPTPGVDMAPGVTGIRVVGFLTMLLLVAAAYAFVNATRHGHLVAAIGEPRAVWLQVWYRREDRPGRRGGESRSIVRSGTPFAAIFTRRPTRGDEPAATVWVPSLRSLPPGLYDAHVAASGAVEPGARVVLLLETPPAESTPAPDAAAEHRRFLGRELLDDDAIEPLGADAWFEPRSGVMLAEIVLLPWWRMVRPRATHARPAFDLLGSAPVPRTDWWYRRPWNRADVRVAGWVLVVLGVIGASLVMAPGPAGGRAAAESLYACAGVVWVLGWITVWMGACGRADARRPRRD